MSHPKETVAHLINGIRSSGRRVLLIGGWSALESHFEGDTDVFTTPAVDHAAVFPLCEAVIHHGGAGTTHAVARAGRPQWIIPKLADQPWWRDLSVKEGFGVRSISLKKLTVKSVHTQIEKLASCVPKANELARAMSKENGLASTLELLDSLVAKH